MSQDWRPIPTANYQVNTAPHWLVDNRPETEVSKWFHGDFLGKGVSSYGEKIRMQLCVLYNTHICEANSEFTTPETLPITTITTVYRQAAMPG